MFFAKLSNENKFFTTSDNPTSSDFFFSIRLSESIRPVCFDLSEKKYFLSLGKVVFNLLK